jgi:ATP-dependent RNA helicase RhlB
MSLPDIETYIGQRIPVANIEADMLVMPQPREQDAQYMAEVAADSAAFGDKVEQREKDGSPRKGSRSGGGRGGDRPRSDKPRERRPRSEVAATEGAAETVVQAPAAPASAPAETGEAGERKRRRRRGGRNRRREGDASTVDTNATPVAEGTRAPRGERRPPRERGNGENNHSRPSRHVAITSGKSAEPEAPKKDGFFRRLSRAIFGH